VAHALKKIVEQLAATPKGFGKCSRAENREPPSEIVIVRRWWKRFADDYASGVNFHQP